MIRFVKNAWPWTVVVVLTSESLNAFRRRCLEAGADFFLDKATGIDDLVRIVEGLALGGSPGATAPGVAI